MSFRSVVLGTPSLIFLANSAVADVTAQDIWSDWQAYMAGFGYSVNATETMSGRTLEITDFKLTVPIPEDGGAFGVTMDRIDFVEKDDGTVELVFPERMPLSFAAQGPDGTPLSGAVEYTMQNMVMQASGDPSKITYNYTADQIGLTLKELIIQGEAVPSDELEVTIGSKDLSGQSIMEPGALRKISQTVMVSETDYIFKYAAPNGEDGFALTGAMAALNFKSDTLIPAILDPEDMVAMLSNGFTLDGTFGYSGSKTGFSFTESGDTLEGSSSAETAEIAIRMNKDLLEYSGASTGVNFNVAGQEIPFPIVAGLGKIAFNMMIPIAKSDDPSDFALGLTFADFVTSDALWSMVDPGTALPRDPATISFDLVGKAKMLIDFFDPKQMEALEKGDVMPAELNAITLRNLVVSAAGAELTGTGAATFDNTDLTSFNGFPKPTGGIDLKLVGGNGLMDGLVKMGLLPQEQAMGARMMMGLFTRPGEGEDTLTTKVEINEQGHILANGQRLK
jgi:hypothetical protein